jgi:purine-binding chemotaxis protein CheW
MSNDNSTRTPRNSAAAGKYLAFILGNESYGIEVLKVREIIKLQPVTVLPQLPSFVRGVINLRGKIIPVLDLRIKFGLPTADATERTCIVVVQVEVPGRRPLQMGLVVDGVEEVLNIAAGDMEPTPEFGTAIDTTYLMAMAKIKGKVIILLDVDKVVAEDLIRQLQSSLDMDKASS